MLVICTCREKTELAHLNAGLQERMNASEVRLQSLATRSGVLETKLEEEKKINNDLRQSRLQQIRHAKSHEQSQKEDLQQLELNISNQASENKHLRDTNAKISDRNRNLVLETSRLRNQIKSLQIEAESLRSSARVSLSPEDVHDAEFWKQEVGGLFVVHLHMDAIP